MKKLFTALLLAAVAPTAAFADAELPKILCLNESNTKVIWFAESVLDGQTQTVTVQNGDEKPVQLSIFAKGLGNDKFVVVEDVNKDKPGMGETVSCMDLTKIRL